MAEVFNAWQKRLIYLIYAAWNFVALFREAGNYWYIYVTFGVVTVLCLGLITLEKRIDLNKVIEKTKGVL
jgi:hypothetical protein